MPSVGLKPTVSAGERPQTHALDRAATGTENNYKLANKFYDVCLGNPVKIRKQAIYNIIILLEMRTHSKLTCNIYNRVHFNPLNAELNPICHLLALLGAHHILHVSRVRVNMVKVSLHHVA